ncbi:hypothetical protein QFC20_006988 [Naganishia adeliensis]|uniref:Uncharacterized protein n=1 Tax=Naganishia adeliensis TaxID=92952 RepID=A0ACC2V4H4_9TREE|nr:hypothetical protein QFC20_006988 [Naganishia adeliensis]
MSGHVHNTNKACCSIPPVQSEYKPKGSYQKVGSFEKAYVIGDSKTHALICIYDIFGFWPQTEQGADILSSTLSGTKVVMPDFLQGNPWPVDQFPPKTDEQKEKLQQFFGTTANPQERLKETVEIAKALQSEGYTSIGLYGFCWGGKVAMLAGSHSELFTGVSIVHPAMLDVKDVEGLAVPLAIFPSKDEPADEVEKIVKALKSKPFADKCTHKTYPNMHHGWAAARGDLSNEENKKEYEDVYSRVAAFFKSVQKA